jgi:periplasmic protein TonB
MFEQSMLLETATGKKTGALAASVTLQAIAVGVLLLIPLFYGEHLPMVHPFLSLAVPLSQPPAPRPAESAATAPSTQHSLLTPRIFHPQTSSAALNSTPVMIDAGAPSIGVVGAPIGVPASTALPRIIDVAPPPAREPAPAVVTKPSEKPVQVGGDVQSAKLLKKVVPQYPPLARAARVSGTVYLVGIIAKDGTIQQLQVVSGNPLLIPAAVNAVRQWIYRPTLLDGETVEVIAPIDVIFTLSQ